jgi:glyoxylase-like metal-dependent hydrolase (beta-lactamase superfamily II)
MSPMTESSRGRIVEVAPLVRLILAPNPSPFTYTGTQTFIVGKSDVAVIDPGPDLPEHINALLAGLEGERITAILCTHTHRDHSPASRALKAATAAPIVGCAALAIEDDGPRADDEFDDDYLPDRVLEDGEVLEGPGWTLEAVHTPGHTSNHLCFALREERALFSGDHVMGWSTTIVSPPDGDMAAYMASLERLLGREDRVYYPAHGPLVETPQQLVRDLIAHRRQREEQILGQLRGGQAGIPDMVPAIYASLDPRLYPAAERSVLAHLIDLQARGLVVQEDGRWNSAE